MFIRIKNKITLDDYPGGPLSLDAGTEVDLLNGIADRLIKSGKADPADHALAKKPDVIREAKRIKPIKPDKATD